MLRWGTSFDFMNVDSTAQDQFSRLYYYDFSSSAAPNQPSVSSFGRFPGSRSYAITSSINSNTKMSKLIKGSSFTEFYLGMAVYVPSAGIDINLPAFGVAELGTTRCQVQFDDFGIVRLYRGRGGSGFGGTLLASSPVMSYRNDAWFYAELGGVLTTDATGVMEVRINTVPVISVVSTITSTGTDLDSVQWTANGNAPSGYSEIAAYFDDVYINDDTGAKNNTFLGNTRVQVLLPDGAGDETDWTPFPSAPNWERANNLLVDDSEYVFAATPGDKDLYTVTPLLNTPAIHGVMLMGAYRQDDATQRSVKNLLKSNGVEVEGDEFFTDSTYTFTQPDIFEDDPDTATTWTYSAVNLIQIGPKLES